MAFNKTRALEEAAKLVNQKKISQAVKLYLAVSGQDATDLNLLNTIGDLCLRENNNAEALRQFHRLASAYVREGFVLKAIAIYRKIAKLEPNSVEPLMKLGELYTQQGLGREAREQYAAALAFCKERALHSWTTEILRKLLVQDAGNLNYRVQLGEAYQSQGSTREALHAFVDAAGLAFGNGDVKSAESALDQARAIDSHFPGIYLARANFALSNRRVEEAVAVLCSEPALESHLEANQLLLQAYLELGRHAEAERVAIELFRRHPQDFTPLGQLSLRLLETRGSDAALQPILDAWDLALEYRHGQQMLHSLQAVLSRHPDHIPALEQCLRLEDALGDQEALPATLAALGEAYSKGRRLEEAEGVYRRLLDLQPQDRVWQERLDEALRRLGRGEQPAGAPDAEAADLRTAADSSAYQAAASEPMSAALGEAIETSDLFVKFGLDDQAVESIEKALEQFPGEIELMTRLVEAASRIDAAQAAQAASSTAMRFDELNDAAQAELYRKRAMELTIQAETARQSPDSPQADTAALLTADAEGLDNAGGAASNGTAADAKPAEASETAETGDLATPDGSANLAPGEANGVGEIDLSDEWEQFISGKTFEEVAPPLDFSPELREQISEIDFYVQYGFMNEAHQLLQTLLQSFPSHPQLLALEHKVRGFNMGARTDAEAAARLGGDAVFDSASEGIEDGVKLPPLELADLQVEMPVDAARPLPNEELGELVAPELEDPQFMEAGQWHPKIELDGVAESEKPSPSAEALNAALDEPASQPAVSAEPPAAEAAAGPGDEPEAFTNSDAMAPKVGVAAANLQSAGPEPVVQALDGAQLAEPAVDAAQPPAELSLDILLQETVPAPQSEPAAAPSIELPLEPDQNPSLQAQPLAPISASADRIELADEPQPDSVHEPEFELRDGQSIAPEAETSFELLEECLPWPGPELDFPLPAETVGTTAVAEASLSLRFSVEEIAGDAVVSPPGEAHLERPDELETAMQPSSPPESEHEAEFGETMVQAPMLVHVPRPDLEPDFTVEPESLELSRDANLFEKPPERENSSPAAGGIWGDLHVLTEAVESSHDQAVGSDSAPAPISQPLPPADLNAELAGLLAELQSPSDGTNFPQNPVTHYNLGVAFREMGLLDEAIGECQKIFKGLRKGTFPPRYLEACTLLADCFREKGMLPIAAKWFERALDMPELDDDTMTAVNYDLAELYQDLGRPQAAMQKYLEVYSQNIDYRDVAERIQALQVKAI